MRVTNRHVIYVQGYDPRGLAQYYRMFRTELRKFDALYGVASSIGRPKDITEGEIASWSIETKAGDWQTRTTYDFLRVEDFIRSLAGKIDGQIERRIAALRLERGETRCLRSDSSAPNDQAPPVVL